MHRGGVQQRTCLGGTPNCGARTRVRAGKLETCGRVGHARDRRRGGRGGRGGRDGWMKGRDQGSTRGWTVASQPRPAPAAGQQASSHACGRLVYVRPLIDGSYVCTGRGLCDLEAARKQAIRASPVDKVVLLPSRVASLFSLDFSVD